MRTYHFVNTKNKYNKKGNQNFEELIIYLKLLVKPKLGEGKYHVLKMMKGNSP